MQLRWEILRQTHTFLFCSALHVTQNHDVFCPHTLHRLCTVLVLCVMLPFFLTLFTTCSLALFIWCSDGIPLAGFGLARKGSTVMLEVGDTMLSVELCFWCLNWTKSVGGVGAAGRMDIGGAGSGRCLVKGLWIKSCVSMLT